MEAAAMTEAFLQPGPSPGEGHQEIDKSLLLVEDDQALRTSLTRVLQSHGFAVHACEGLPQGLAVIQDQPPAFAVVDLKLRDGNGLHVIRELRRRRGDARAIVLTGFGSPELAVAAIKAGAANFLIKPADADDIIDALLAP